MISVIIPTYKPQTYLWECLDSVCNQTLSKDNFEVILVLNGCKEPYNSQIQDYISKHQDVIWNYIQTDIGGVSNARNIAMVAATGDYATFIDDDDYISPSYLDEMLSLADKDTMVFAKPIAFWDDTREYKSYVITDEYQRCAPKGRQKASNVRKFFSGPWMKLIPKSYIQGRFFDVRFKNGEDSLFMFLISDRFKDVVFTSDKSVYYRRVRENSATTTHRSKLQVIRDCIAPMKVITKIYFSAPARYSFKFYISRMLGGFHTMLKGS